MFNHLIVTLDWLGVVVFAITGALVASRNQMDLVGFALLAVVTGVGGGTLRDVMIGITPVFWVEQPAYLIVCLGVAVVMFFTAHLIQSRYRLLLWLDGAGLALFAAAGAERAIEAGAAYSVAVAMGAITGTFGGIIRDVLSGEKSIIFSREIYVTAAVAAATGYIVLLELGVVREAAILGGVACGFLLRAGALAFGWVLPRYRTRPAADRTG